jgi:hypothetical protein
LPTQTRKEIPITSTRGVTKLRSGREQKIYFFAREQKEGVQDKLPDGYQVSETANGLPVLKKA